MRTSVWLLVLLIVVAYPQRKEQESNPPPLTRALTELKTGHIDKVIELLTEVINKNPKNAEVYFWRSKLRLSLNDIYGAIGDVNKAIQLKRTLGSAYQLRARIRLLAKDNKGALKDLDKAIAKGDSGDGVYLLRAQVRTEIGDLSGALSDYAQARRLNPANPQAYDLRASLLLLVKDQDRAFQDLNFLLTWFENDPMKRGEVKSVSGSITPANANSDSVNDFRRAMEPGPVNAAPGDKEMVPVIAHAYLNRGLIKSSRGEVEAAIADFTKSIRMEATNVWAFYNRAKELEKRGNWEAALADVSRSIQLDPMNGDFRIEHGVLLFAMGKAAEAQLDFDMLLNMDRILWQKRIDDRLAEVKKKLPANPN